MKKNKVALLLILGLLLVIFSGIGMSYSLWTQSHTQNTYNEALSGCFSTAMSENNNIDLSNQFPVTDTTGLKRVPYTFTISNTCTIAANYQINLETLSNTSVDSKFIKASLDGLSSSLLNTYPTMDTTITGAKSSYELKKGYLAAGSSVTYNLRLWITEEATVYDVSNKMFNSKVVVNTSAAHDSIADVLINNAGGKTTIAAKTAPDFSVASITDDGMFSAPDDYGTSYYYRGNVLNNNIIFANICWKAIRVNGNNTTRLIYNGLPTNGECNATGNNSLASFSTYNTNNNDNAYVGYMYGSNLTSSYSDTHSNINSSSIKDYLETWYQSNLLSYDSKINDSLFCNDRSLSSGTGLSSTFTVYKANSRIGTNFTPTFICPQKNDKLTKNDNQIGNAVLKYSIGLVSIDEVEYAGSNMGTNKDFYLYNTNWYYTMTPNYYSDNPSIFIVGDSVYSTNSNSIGGVRPVINLNYDGLVSTGKGTISNPYIISE